MSLQGYLTSAGGGEITLVEEFITVAVKVRTD